MTLKFDKLLLKPDEVDFVIYHANCSDGFGSAMCAELYRRECCPNKEIIYYPATFNKPPPDIKNKNVLICDFSYKKEIIMNMIKDANKLAILDHHKTAEIELKDLSDEYKVITMDYSGAYITWKYFCPNKQVPKAIEYIQDNDLWKKILPKTLEFTAYMFTLPFTFDEYIKLFDDDFVKNVVFVEGTGMVHQNQATVENSLKYVSPKFMEINNKYYFVAHLNATVLKSEIGNKIFDKFIFCNFSAIYSIDDMSNTTSFSLRSTKNRSDVSEIAKLFNGGGHVMSSGVKVNMVTNVLPATVLDDYVCYQLLSNISIKNNFNNMDVNCVILNCTHKMFEIGKYLLQIRYKDDDGKYIQECTNIMRQLNSDNKFYDCDMALIWHHAGNFNKIWCMAVFTNDLYFNKNKFDKVMNVLKLESDFENKGQYVTFTKAMQINL